MINLFDPKNIPARPCYSCDELTHSTIQVCERCYIDPVNNNCTKCGKHLSNIPYEYVCGGCLG